MSCLASNEQHVPSMHKHWRLCSLHTHDVGVHAHTGSHGLFSLEHLYQQHWVATTFYGTGRKPQKKNERNTSCLTIDGQHAHCTRQHCRLCAMHAHDTGVCAHTCLHSLIRVANTYQPGTFQWTSSWNNRLRCRSIPSYMTYMILHTYTWYRVIQYLYIIDPCPTGTHY